MLLARDGGHKVEDQQPHVADDHHIDPAAIVDNRLGLFRLDKLDPAAIVDDLLGLTQVDC